MGSATDALGSLMSGVRILRARAAYDKFEMVSAP
jgi:hypothetical protein